MESVKFSIDNITEFRSDENPELALACIEFLSTAKNDHKINITPEILKRDAPTILGKFLVGEMDIFGSDATNHTENQVIFGYYPSNQKVKFYTNKNGDLVASATAVVSKLYAYDFYNIFKKDNLRNVSVEMQTIGNRIEEDGTINIEGFNLTATTCLNKTINGSCPDAKMRIIRFSEEEANEFYNNALALNETPVNTSKDAIDYGEWNGDEAKHNLIKEKNFEEIAPIVCLKLEDGWEDRTLAKLKYPVMNIYDGEWRYSLKGLTSAKAYAEKENEVDVLDKLKEIYEKLEIGGNMDTRQFELEIEELQSQIAELTQKCEELECANEELTQKCEELESAKEQLAEETAKCEELECANKELAEKCEEAEAEVKEKDEIIMECNKQLSELNEFKTQQFEMMKETEIKEFLSKFESKVSPEELEAIEAKFEGCTYECLEEIKKDVLSDFAIKLLSSDGMEDGIFFRYDKKPKDKQDKGLWG